MYSETWARVACGLIFLGFNMVFLVQFFLGSKGMPRRYYTYLDQFQPMHAFSTSGTWVLGLGFILVVFYLIDSLLNGEQAPANPWGGLTLEWRAASPPVLENFDTPQQVTHDPYDYENGPIPHA
jgi:cytochrome c oxidase subunit 1